MSFDYAAFIARHAITVSGRVSEKPTMGACVLVRVSRPGTEVFSMFVPVSHAVAAAPAPELLEALVQYLTATPETPALRQRNRAKLRELGRALTAPVAFEIPDIAALNIL